MFFFSFSKEDEVERERRERRERKEKNQTEEEVVSLPVIRARVDHEFFSVVVQT